MGTFCGPPPKLKHGHPLSEKPTPKKQFKYLDASLCLHSHGGAKFSNNSAKFFFVFGNPFRIFFLFFFVLKPFLSNLLAVRWIFLRSCEVDCPINRINRPINRNWSRLSSPLPFHEELKKCSKEYSPKTFFPKPKYVELN